MRDSTFRAPQTRSRNTDNSETLNADLDQLLKELRLQDSPPRTQPSQSLRPPASPFAPSPFAPSPFRDSKTNKEYTTHILDEFKSVGLYRQMFADCYLASGMIFTYILYKSNDLYIPPIINAFFNGDKHIGELEITTLLENIQNTYNLHLWILDATGKPEIIQFVNSFPMGHASERLTYLGLKGGTVFQQMQSRLNAFKNISYGDATVIVNMYKPETVTMKLYDDVDGPGLYYRSYLNVKFLQSNELWTQFLKTQFPGTTCKAALCFLKPGLGDCPAGETRQTEQDVKKDWQLAEEWSHYLVWSPTLEHKWYDPAQGTTFSWDKVSAMKTQIEDPNKKGADKTLQLNKEERPCMLRGILVYLIPA